MTAGPVAARQADGSAAVQLDEREARPRNGFGTLLRGWREHAGLTQERLAERAGLGVRTIRNLERGRARPLPETVRLLGDALGLDDGARRRFDAAAHQPPGGAWRHALAAADLPGGLLAPAQLPADVAGFTGRGEQLRQLDALLAEAGGDPEGGSRPRAVVVAAIAGGAGVGKTALAVHWAHRARGRFPDGQVYVDLRGYGPGAPLRPIDALAQLLRTLGVAAQQVPVEVGEAAALYRSLLAGRRVLVVLDDAGGAEQVRPLLPGSDGCAVVVTSRDRLGGLVARDGARRVLLGALPPDEAVGLLGAVLGRARVAAEPAAAAELARVCAHLPLAVRIAAANLAGQPQQTIAGYLAQLRAGDPLAELAIDGDRQAAVRAAFDCSYVALEADARRLFRLLGLCPGRELAPEAAAALAGLPLPEAARLLQRLAGAHLLEQRAPGRFAFHDLLRLYARQRTEQEDGEAERKRAIERLLGWYLHAAGTAAALRYPKKLRLPVPPAGATLPAAGFEDRAGALGWLEAERPNLVAAVEHAAAHGPRPVAWLLADTLRAWFWEQRHVVDWLAAGSAAVRAADAERDPRAQAAAQRVLGMAYECLGDYARASEHQSSAIGHARKAGWADGEAASLGSLGLAYAGLGQLRQAVAHHAQALAVSRRTGHKDGQAIALNNLGDAARQLGRPQRAVEHLTEALALQRELGRHGGQAVTLSTLGDAYRDLGRLAEAQACLRTALALAREAGNRYEEATNLAALAAAERDAGRLVPAGELAEAAVALAREIGDPRVEADALNALGGVQLARGCWQQATERHQQAFELACRIGARYPQAEALLGLAAACQQRGQHARAARQAGQAHAIAAAGGFRILEGRAHAALATAHLGQGRCDEADGHARQALAISVEAGHRAGQARALVLLGHARQRAGDAEAPPPATGR